MNELFVGLVEHGPTDRPIDRPGRAQPVWVFRFGFCCVKFVFRWIQMTSDKLSYCGQRYQRHRHGQFEQKNGTDFSFSHLFLCEYECGCAAWRLHCDCVVISHRYLLCSSAFVAVTLCDVLLHCDGVRPVLSHFVHRKWNCAMHVDTTEFDHELY